MDVHELRFGKTHILYSGVSGPLAPEFFEPSHWEEKGALAGGSRGRGVAVFIRDGEREMVLRHYRRGGLPARISKDRYLFLNLEASRPWREWKLIAQLFDLGLPVPRPVAARVQRYGLLYSGDLVTERIPDAEPLSQHLSRKPLNHESWRAVGRSIRRFHRAGVDHADLNAHNILLNAAGEVFLIDFDRGRIRPVGSWVHANLERLHRSLEKLRGQSEGFAFRDADWEHLLAGYRENP